MSKACVVFQVMKKTIANIESKMQTAQDWLRNLRWFVLCGFEWVLVLYFYSENMTMCIGRLGTFNLNV